MSWLVVLLKALETSLLALSSIDVLYIHTVPLWTPVIMSVLKVLQDQSGARNTLHLSLLQKEKRIQYRRLWIDNPVYGVGGDQPVERRDGSVEDFITQFMVCVLINLYYESEGHFPHTCIEGQWQETSKCSTLLPALPSCLISHFSLSFSFLLYTR